MTLQEAVELYIAKDGYDRCVVKDPSREFDWDEDQWNLVLRMAEPYVREAFRRSRFNEKNLTSEEIGFDDVCNEWLVFADEDERRELLNLVELPC